MKKFAISLIAAGALAQPALSATGDILSDSRAKPNSYVPHTHSKHHVYGAPMQPAIVGHGRTTHRNHTPKKPPSSEPTSIPP